ncbi:autotransporter family protein, partial [Intestinicryptomonas porci]|nr:autotransporter domain-containing protein [Opitutales bacterium CLA-KB-P66]
SAGKITAGDLGNINAENATINGIDATAGAVKNVTVGTTTGAVELGTVKNTTITTAKGDVTIIEVETLDITLEDNASLNAEKVTSKAVIAGNADATINELVDNASIEVNNEGSTIIENIGNGAEVTASAGETTVNNTADSGENTLNANGGTSIWQSLKNKLNIFLNGADANTKVTVRNEYAQGEVEISAADTAIGTGSKGTVEVTNVEKLTLNTKGDETLTNSSATNLLTQCDIQTTLENAKETDVIVNGKLDKLAVDGTSVKSLTIKDDINNDGSIKNFTGDVTFAQNTSKLNVNDLTGDVTFKDAQNTVTAGNIEGDINIASSNNSELVLDGTVNNININSDIQLGSEGSDAVIAGNINAGTKNITVNASGKDITFNNPTVSKITAGSLKGNGATGFVDSLLNGKYKFDENATGVNTLIGNHNDDSISATLDVSNKTVAHEYITVEYNNRGSDNSKVSFDIKKNTYLQDVFAKTANENQLAKIYDNLKYNSNGNNSEALQLKQDFMNNAGNGTLGAVLPQSTSHAIRMNMDLAHIVHLDTLNRVSQTRDLLNALSPQKRLTKGGRPGTIVQGTTTASIRSINKFSSYSGDSNMSGSNDFIYGGLANVEYIATKDLFAGFGVGGFNAKSNGKHNAGDAETQSVLLNAYLDYACAENFDWYLGITYAFGMTDAERKNLSGDKIKSDWNSHMINGFTGLRYSWKPYFNTEFFVKPIIGLNATLLLNPDIDEKSGSRSDLMRIESDNYASVKSILGVELTYVYEKFTFGGKLLYAHEFADDSYDIDSSFLNLNSTATMLRSRGTNFDRDTGLFGVGAGYNIDKHWRIYLDYAVEFSSDLSHNLNLGAQYRF